MLIEIVGKFYDNHSLSLVNRNLALELSKLTQVQIIPMDSPNSSFNLSNHTLSQLKALETPQGTPNIQLRHSYPPIFAWPDDPSVKIVYIQPWEYSKAPFEWQYKFETFADALIVPSNYTRNVFLQGGLNPNKVFTIPNGYNRKIFNIEPTDVVIPEIDDKKLNILFVGNNQWRKGLDILLRVWYSVFVKADNIRLIIKDSPSIYGKTNILSELIKGQYKSKCAEMVYIDRELSDLEMAALFKKSKVLVHPYRAEGFAMHVQEAMACGTVPVISSNGPTDDFVLGDVGIKIPTYRRIINITDEVVFAIKPGDAVTLMGSHTPVQEPDPKALAAILHSIYQSHDIEDYLSSRRADYCQNTWEHVARLYHSVLLEINSREKVQRA